MRALRERLERGLMARVPSLTVNGAGSERLPDNTEGEIDRVLKILPPLIVQIAAAA